MEKICSEEIITKKLCVELLADGATQSNIPRSVKVNDILDLVFVETHGNTLVTHKPDFTHQLFDNEMIDLQSDPMSQGRVTIEVNCANLSHKVSIPTCFTCHDTELLKAGLSKAIPSETDTNNMQIGVSVGNPPGTLLHCFETHGDNYEIYRATAADAGACELLSKAEKIAMWFIETADAVDFTDDRWEALFLYVSAKKAADQELSVETPTRYFAGYITLFSFRNPFRGTKLRVCQALVLPHRQSLGLGRHLLQAVYQHVVQARTDICELTVEDPAVGFQRLRDAVDLECLFAHNPGMFNDVAVAVAVATGSDADPVGKIPTEPEVCTALKIIKTQAQFLLECVEYIRVVRTLLTRADALVTTAVNVTGNKRSLTAAPDDLKRLFKLLDTCEDFKSFRLRVKKRILKNDKDLASITPKTAMQKALSEEFEEELKRFQAMESTAVRLGLVSSKLNVLL